MVYRRASTPTKRKLRMPRLVVVVNHWGGVPKALHANVAGHVRSLHPDGNLNQDATLPSVDPHASFESCILLSRSPLFTVFHAAQRAGFKTALLGVHGLPTVALEHDSIEDPRLALEDWGVDHCSPRDGASFRGDAQVHDTGVLEEVTRVVDGWRRERGGVGLLLVINLLAYRNVAFAAPQRAEGWECMVPTATVAARPSWALHTPPFDGSEDPAVTAGQYADRLAYSMAVHRDVMHTLDCLFERCAGASHVACMNTQSLSIGEHGTRRPLPTGTCCTGVFGSTPALHPPPLHATMRDGLLAFLFEACGLAISMPTPGAAVTLTAPLRHDCAGAAAVYRPLPSVLVHLPAATPEAKRDAHCTGGL